MFDAPSWRRPRVPRWPLSGRSRRRLTRSPRKETCCQLSLVQSEDGEISVKKAQVILRVLHTTVFGLQSQPQYVFRASLES